MRRLFVLRPEPGASATVERARELGLDGVAASLFAIEAVEWDAPDPTGFDALLLTSANAVRFAGPDLRQLIALPVYAVGRTTAAAAHDAGFTGAGVGDGGLERLLSSIPADLRLLHLCGEDRICVEPRQAVTAVPVYRATPLPAPEELARLEGQCAAIHSPRAGRRLAELADALAIDRSTIGLAAISPAAAEAAGDGWEACEAASEPTDPALLALAARLCNKPVR